MNWRELTESGTTEFICFKTSFSRHFTAAGVSVKSFVVVVSAFLGTGTITEDLKIRGTVYCEREVIKMCTPLPVVLTGL